MPSPRSSSKAKAPTYATTHSQIFAYLTANRRPDFELRDKDGNRIMGAAWALSPSGLQYPVPPARQSVPVETSQPQVVVEVESDEPKLSFRRFCNVL